MRKFLVMAMVLCFAASLASAAQGTKDSLKPISTVVKDTGVVVKKAAVGTADTLNIEKNNPVTTAVDTVADVADASVKTVTLQDIDEDSGNTANEE